MEWMSQNWVWVLLAVGMTAMHLFGHGGHGGHGGNDDRQVDAKSARKDNGPEASGPYSGDHN